MVYELLLLFLVMIIQVIIPPIPAEIVVILAGARHGILLTTFIAGTGLWLGGILVYHIGAYVHKKGNVLFSKSKVKEITQRIKKYESAILWIRILPYNPSDIISYAAGVLKFDQKKFVIITGITSYVRCFVLAYLAKYTTSFRNIAYIALILVASAIIAKSLLTKKRK